MKKIILGGLLGIIISATFAFKAINYEPNKSTAEVYQYEGLYIFVDSKPVKEYQYLGTVKTYGWGNNQYVSLKDRLIYKTKKDYPQADAIIITFKSGAADVADAIKFK